MTQTICPGQDTRYWRPEDVFEVACAECGYEVEFFKDDAQRRCRRCGAKVRNPRLNLGCAQWCEHAAKCLGYDPKERLAQAAGEEALLDKLIAAMKRQFGSDQKRISHALSVLDFAQRLLKVEKAEPKVVLAAAVLHDIGIQEAERRHGSSAGRFQELEGPPIAEEIMKSLGLDEETREHVAKIVANHHSAQDIDTPEFRIIWDADWLVNLPEEFPDHDQARLASLINKVFKTAGGKTLAVQLFLESPTIKEG